MNSIAHAGPETDSAPGGITPVREMVGHVRFGVLQLVIHDGRVTRIERTEKTRLPAAGERAAPNFFRPPVRSGDIHHRIRNQEPSRLLE